MGLISGKFFECGIFINSRFYLRRAVCLVHYAIYTLDNITLVGRPLLWSLSIFQIQQVESNAELQDIMNSDVGFDILEKIGYPGAPTSVTISDKTKILG